ncbi:MAG: geranylgeranylglycerol-phosphate geranylgeranyltransferase [candidate division WOR-3 bacterium]|nr:geranylgeranylglycerol-phosphate geranylgeranyltransferase [candidate division WOR-3 bacterium]
MNQNHQKRNQTERTIPSSQNKIIAFIYLIRLNNSLISILSLMVAIYIGNRGFETDKLMFSILTVFFLSSGGNIINDYFDIETDRINKPQRPLISSVFNLRVIFIMAVSMLLLGIVFSVFINLTTLLIAFSASVLLFLYSWKFKRMPVIGNLTIASLSGLLFIYGALIAENIAAGIFPAVFAFLMTFGREITKDIEDIEGDREAGMKTLPILIGKGKTMLIASVNFLILIIVSFIPYFIGMYNKWYFFIVVFGVDIVIIILLSMFFLFDDIKTKRFVNNYLKYDMIIGLLAVIMGIN